MIIKVKYIFDYEVQEFGQIDYLFILSIIVQTFRMLFIIILQSMFRID